MGEAETLLRESLEWLRSNNEDTFALVSDKGLIAPRIEALLARIARLRTANDGVFTGKTMDRARAEIERLEPERRALEQEESPRPTEAWVVMVESILRDAAEGGRTEQWVASMLHDIVSQAPHAEAMRVLPGHRPEGNGPFTVQVIDSSHLKVDDVFWQDDGWYVVTDRGDDGIGVAFRAAPIIDDSGGQDKNECFEEGFFLRLVCKGRGPFETFKDPVTGALLFRRRAEEAEGG
jgi:hypothetical protein